MWIELSVSADVAAVEALSALFHQYGEGGVAIDQPFLTDREGERFAVDLSRPARVRTYLPDTPDGAERRRRIEEGLWHLSAFGLAPIGEMQAKRIHEDDWANAWKEHYHPIRVGRLLVKPSWREVEHDADTVVVEIDPGMAFGTGLHQTTRMCLSAVEQLVAPGMVVIDQGTGSGILAISAAKLGARLVMARDIAEVAVTVALDNAKRNGVRDICSVKMVEANADVRAQVLLSGEQPPADLVIANIIASVIIRLAESFVEASKLGARLIASGIIRERESEVADALIGAGYHIDERLHEDEWVTLLATLVTKPSPASS